MKLTQVLIAAFFLLGVGTVFAATIDSAVEPVPIIGGATTAVVCPPLCV